MVRLDVRGKQPRQPVARAIAHDPCNGDRAWFVQHTAGHAYVRPCRCHLEARSEPGRRGSEGGGRSQGGCRGGIHQQQQPRASTARSPRAGATGGPRGKDLAQRVQEHSLLGKLQNLERGVLLFTKPVFDAHSRNARELRSEGAAQQWHLAMARGHYFRDLGQVVEASQDPKGLQHVGLA